MKTLFVLILAFAGLAQASSQNFEPIYVYKKAAVVGCANSVCSSLDSAIANPILGMNAEVDELTSQFDFNKTYICSGKGQLVYGAKLFKVYELSRCEEVSSKGFLEQLNRKNELSQ